MVVVVCPELEIMFRCMSSPASIFTVANSQNEVNANWPSIRDRVEIRKQNLKQLNKSVAMLMEGRILSTSSRA